MTVTGANGCTDEASATRTEDRAAPAVATAAPGLIEGVIVGQALYTGAIDLPAAIAAGRERDRCDPPALSQP